MPNREFNEFTDNLNIALSLFLNKAKENADIKSIYNKGIAAFKILSAWAPDNRELLGAAAGAAKRAATLACIRQYSLVNVELRRFIECITLYAFFNDHPVEWEVFKKNPGRSWKNKPEKPIEQAANSPIHYYFRYIQERMFPEPSGLAKTAVAIFRDEYDKVSLHIHGSVPAMQGSLALSYDKEDQKQNNELRLRSHKIFKSGCIIVSALKVRLLEMLNATEREVFDKLISPATAKKIREQPFGI